MPSWRSPWPRRSAPLWPCFLIVQGEASQCAHETRVAVAAANEMLNACHGLGLSHRDFVTVFDAYRLLGGAG